MAGLIKGVLRTIACTVAALLMIVGTIIQAKAETGFSTKAEFAILMDAETQSVLFEKNADKLMQPASMSKLATLAIIFQALKAGRMTLDDEFHVSENAWRNGGAPSGTSAMFASLNSKVKVSDLLQGIIVQSGNDACIIMAEAMTGSEQAFAEEMTKYIRKIGLTKSKFQNSTGLPAENHLMTSRELAILAAHIIKEYPEHYQYFKQKEFRYKRYRFFNRNPLIAQNIGADGLKTGYTKGSGYGLVASVKRDNRRLIVVVNGLTSKRERTQEARRLIEWGFRSFKSFKLFEPNEVVGEARVWGGTESYVSLIGKNGVFVYLPRFGNHKLKASIVYQGPLKPPIKKGDQVAYLQVITANSARNRIPLYASEDIGVGGIFSKGFDSLLYLAFGWLL